MGIGEQTTLVDVAPDDYLRFEDSALDKHEYLDGTVLAPQVRSAAHNRVVMNVVMGLRAQARASGCEVFASNLRLQIGDRSAYFYPDVMVRCGAPVAGDAMEINDA